MKLFNRRRLSVMLMTSIILLQGVSPLLAIATTVESSTVESSTTESTTDSNSVETPEAVTEEVPAAEEQVAEPEYVDVEAAYEENKLSTEYQEASAQPTVNLIEKNLTGELTIKGEILAGIEQQETRRTETHLTNLVLQCNESDDSWDDVHTFEIEDDSAAIQAEKYAFDFSKSLDEIKAGNYRLIAEYDIQEYEEENLKRVNQHKGMFVVGKVEEESEEEASSSDSDASSQNFTQSDAKSSTNQLPFNGSLYASNGLGRSGNPALEVIYQGPREFNRVGITNVKSRSATAQVSYEADQHLTVDGTTYAVWSTSSTYMRDVIQPSQLIGNSYSLSETDWQRLVNNGNYTQGEIVSSGGGRRQDKFNLTGLLPHKDYYVWFIRIVTTTGPFGSITTRSGYFPADTTQGLNNDKNIYNPFWFKTDMPDPLSITTPEFTQTSATPTSISMVGKRYTGDIFQTNNQGKVQVTPNGTTIQDKVTNLGYTISSTPGGTYNSTTVGGLEAGTRYKGRVAIKNYLEGWEYSDWSEDFYTPNTVRSLSVPTKNTPTNQNNATASFTAGYNVGNVAAHPKKVRVKYKEAAVSGWQEMYITGGINTTSKEVNFTLSNLKSNTDYNCVVAFLNDSNVWSPDSFSRNFKTNPIKLTMDTPKFYHDNSTRDGTKIRMMGQRYYGDITQTNNQGRIEIHNGVTTRTAVTNLSHDVGTGTPGDSGIKKYYHGVDITGLEPGTRYRGKVIIKDLSGNEQETSWGGWNGDNTYFYTPNTVRTFSCTSKNDPTTPTNASATFTAGYNVGDEPAHPNEVRIKYKLASAASSDPWDEYVATSGINTATKEATVTVPNLKSNTDYYAVVAF